MRNILHVEADIKGQRRVPAYTVTQNDSIRIVVTVLDGGEPVQLDGITTITLASTRRDGYVVVKAGEQTGPNEVTVDLGTTEIELTGKVDAVLQLYAGEDRVSTIKFAFTVTKDPTGEGFVPSEKELTLIEVVLGNGPLVLERAVEAADSAEAAVDYIEDKRPLIDKFTDEQTSLQTQLDEVARGATNVETSQARVDAKGGSHATLKARLDAEQTAVTSQLAQTVNPTSFIRKPQSPMPDKKGAKINSPKIIVKNGTDNFSIIQKKNKEYILYSFNKSMGDTGASSVGGSWDLVRLKKAKSVAMAYVAKTAFTHTGTLTTLYAPAQENTAETVLFPLINTIPTEHLSSAGGGLGIGMYGISSTSVPTEATFKLTIGKTRRANVLLFGTANHTSTADIIVNGDIVKTFKPSAISTGSNNYRIVDFDIPTRYLGTTVDVVLRNNDITGQKLYFGGVNFYELEKYEGQDVDLFKAFVKDETFIDTNGASDYAIFDNDLQKWCGSYHGGETRIAAKMSWINDYSKKFDVEARFTTTDMADANITTGAWIITKDFKMYQVTNINNKAKMVSEFDFNTDGTIDMTFGLYDNIIKSRTFFTSLTSTHKDFDYVYLPRYEKLVSGIVGKVFFDLSEGYLKQVNSTKKIEIDQRFTKFHDEYNPEGTYVYNDSNLYRKFYYGIAVNYDGGVVIPSLTFSKALDFIKQ